MKRGWPLSTASRIPQYANHCLRPEIRWSTQMGTFRQLTPTVPPLKSMKERSEYRVPRPPTRPMAHEEMGNTDKGNLGRRDMRDWRPAAFRIHPKHPGFAEPYGVQVLSPSGNRDSRLSRVRQVGATISVQDRGRAPKIVRIDLTVVAH